MQFLMPTCNKTQTRKLPVVSELNSSFISSMYERKVVRMFGVIVRRKPLGTLTGLFILKGFNYRYPSTLCMTFDK